MTTQCIGFHFNENGDDHQQNPYRGKNLFDDKNYQAVLDRLNNGYNVLKALIESMKEHRDLREKDADRLAAQSKSCISRLNSLSLLAHYGTTAEVQRFTYMKIEEQAKEIRNSCKIIEEAINKLKQQVNEMYPKRTFHITRKHYRAEEIELKFINARKPYQSVLDRLAKLRIKSEKVQNPSQVHEDLTEAEKEEQAKYVVAVNKIFQECQQLEKERLDLVKEAVLDFINSIHPSQYSTGLLKNFAEILSHVKDTQNSEEDLRQWATLLEIQVPTS